MRWSLIKLESVSWDRLGVLSVQTAGHPTWTINPQKQRDKPANNQKSMLKLDQIFCRGTERYTVSVFSLRSLQHAAADCTRSNCSRRAEEKKPQQTLCKLTSVKIFNELFLTFFLLKEGLSGVFLRLFGWCV